LKLLILWLIYLGLSVIGLWVGTQVNRAIYDWAWFVEISPSPYSRKPRLENQSPWRWVPVVGWSWLSAAAGQTLYPTALKNAAPEEKKFIPILGRLSFLRPACVELLCGIGLPMLAWYYHSGQWVGTGWHLSLVDGQATTVWIWCGFHAGILALLLIASLIDWDEHTIPDQVTTTGVVLALLVTFSWPAVRLPTLQFEGAVATAIAPVHVFSPQAFPAELVTVGSETGPNSREDSPQSSRDNGDLGILAWTQWNHVTPFLDPRGLAGLGTVCLGWIFWASLILPSVCTLRFGWSKGLWLMLMSVRQPPRKTKGLATRVRRVNPVTWVALAVMSLALLVSVLAWNLGASRWEAIYSLTLSMVLAGLGTWIVRLLATWAMKREALGFGDVTLMFMIGAAFGWQFALMVFAIAPVLAISFAVYRIVTTGDYALAFGPWLALAAFLVLMFWAPIWRDFARDSLFGMGPFLLLVVGLCLLLMPVALLILLSIKRLLGWER